MSVLRCKYCDAALIGKQRKFCKDSHRKAFARHGEQTAVSAIVRESGRRDTPSGISRTIAEIIGSLSESGLVQLRITLCSVADYEHKWQQRIMNDPALAQFRPQIKESKEQPHRSDLAELGGGDIYYAHVAAERIAQLLLDATWEVE